MAATSLADDLPLLEAAVPLLAGRFGKVVDEISELAEATRRAGRRFAEHRTQVVAQKERLEEALAAHADRAREGVTRVQDAAIALLDGLAAEEDAVAEEVDRLEQEGETAEQAFEGLRIDLDGVGDDVHAAESAALEALERLAEGTRVAAVAVRAAHDDATSAAVEAEAALHQGRQQAAQAADALRAAITGAAARLREVVDAARERLTALASAQEAAAAEAVGRLEERTAELGAQIGARTVDAPDPFLLATETIGNEAESAARELAGLGTTVVADGTLLRDRAADVRQHVPALRASVAEVRAAAERVGLTWP